jgi:hypothetical protein
MNEPRSNLARLLIVLAGIMLGQAALYGPSLIGRKILLPLDILAGEHVYLPRTPQFANIEPSDIFKLDLVFASEPGRRFAASELRAGRFPLWAPHQYAGAPFILSKFSPFFLLECCTVSPVVLAWVQLLGALVAGLGAHLFFRRALGVGYWPAAICAWCYPLTDFFIFWQGYMTTTPVFCLPWLLLAVNRAVRGTCLAAPVGLAIGYVPRDHGAVGYGCASAIGVRALWSLVLLVRSPRFNTRDGKTEGERETGALSTA